ncbi:MAG: hypothetical protein IJ104_01015 [Methanobrevibacter sp.]|nr:hypothetical protein [Methanobrevibacter sp.]MBQ9024951.1 hypothetical protein [Methanobrevibacter sp.]
MNIEKLKVDIQLRQEALNKKFAEEGLTDEVLDKQVELNSLRNKYDIPDDLEDKLYEDFVQ